MLDERLALGCVSGEKATAVPMRPNLTNKKLGEYFREVGGDLLARDDGHALAAQVALAPCHVVGQVLVGGPTPPGVLGDGQSYRQPDKGFDFR